MGPRDRERPRLRSSRLRILGWVLVPAAVVLLISWVAARQVLVDQLDDRIERELTGEVSELRLLATEGSDPRSGGRFSDPQSLMRLFLDRSIPDANETMFAVVDGVVDARTSDIPPVRIDTRADLVDIASSAAEVVYGSLDTEAGQVQYVAVPVSVDGSTQRGALVVGIFADLEGREVNDLVRTQLLVSLAALLLATILGWFVAGRVLAPVRNIGDTARSISESDLTRRIPVRGSGDELDDLARTFNDMLDRLETAFAAQREFIDDAGHELRTPLTIVRGHLELIDVNPEDREQTVALVMDELDRMSRIVHDLQTLTRSNQPGFVRLAPVDIGDLTDEVVVKASALSDIRCVLDDRAEGVVMADRHRLTQAMVQLAQNALRYSRPDAEVGIGSRVLGESVQLWVRDLGPGVPDADKERIFERFVRSDRQADTGEGAGLGLSIVQAIAAAHDGSVEVTDNDSGGATFTMTIPLARPHHGRGE